MAGAARYSAYRESVIADGGEVTVVTNSDCVLICPIYNKEVSSAITSFGSSKNIANKADTLIIKSGEVSCSIMMEKYIDTAGEFRSIRSGMLSSDPPRCEFVSNRVKSTQDDLPDYTI